MWKKIGLWMALLAGWLGMVCGTASAAPVTMQVADGDVRSALLSAARVGGINLVLDGSVDGTVTLSLTAEPEEILRHIAAVRGLSLIPEGDHTYLVTAAKGDGLREAHIWPVQYADPHELAQAVNLSLGKEENSFAVTNNNKIGNSKNDEERAGKTVESGFSWMRPRLPWSTTEPLRRRRAWSASPGSSMCLPGRYRWRRASWH